jgi:hypothetical protein
VALSRIRRTDVRRIVAALERVSVRVGDLSWIAVLLASVGRLAWRQQPGHRSPPMAGRDLSVERDTPDCVQSVHQVARRQAKNNRARPKLSTLAVVGMNRPGILGGSDS